MQKGVSMTDNKCPRCGVLALEYLATHAHCWECGYSPEFEEGYRTWRDLEFRKPTKRSYEHPIPAEIRYANLTGKVL